MANENNENLNSLNEEHSEVKIEETDDVVVLKDKLQKVSDTNRQLFARAKKAEGFELGSDGKWVKAQEPKPELKPEAKLQSNEPDYGKLAFLTAKGIDHSDDVKIVMDESVRLKLPITDVLGMEHIKARLQVNKDARSAQSGMPRGSNRAGGVTQHDVDYWVEKGEGLPDDQALAEKVVEARMGKDSSQQRFAPIRV